MEKILKNDLVWKISLIRRFIFPARGPNKNTQAIAPRNGGVRRDRKLTFLIRLFRGIFVLDKAQPIGAPTNTLKKVAPEEIIRVFRKDSLIALSVTKFLIYSMVGYPFGFMKLPRNNITSGYRIKMKTAP